MFTDNEFRDQYEKTLDIEFRVKIIEINGKTVKIQIWDTAGYEDFQEIRKTFYKGEIVALLVYDITQKKTFEKVKNYYINEIKNNCKDDVIVLLLANKTDLEKNREVTSEEGIKLAKYESYEFK